MKRLGIVGGLGPQATAVFYSNVARRVHELVCDVNIVISSASPSKDLEFMHVTGTLGGNVSSFQPAMSSVLKDLRIIGASGIVMPCFSLTELLKEQASQFNLPIILPFQRAARKVEEGGFKRLCVLGTPYIKEVLDREMQTDAQVVVPAPRLQIGLNELVSNVLSGCEPKSLEARLGQICEEFSGQGDGFLIACSEICLIPVSPQIASVNLLTELEDETLDVLLSAR